MKKITAIIGLVLIIYSCAKVPITGRKQLHILPESQVVALSLTQYHDFLSTNQVVVSGTEVQMVKNVTGKLTEAVKKVMAQTGNSSQIAGFNWEVNLVQKNEMNAWCMPGGKIVVYSGILPVTKDEYGLATVLGHEIAHAVAGHGNERLSQQLSTYAGLTALDIALQSKPKETHDMLMAAVGAGAEVGILLPFSRTQESEADRLGLIFMAAAGYDPHKAVNFWQDMQAQTKGAKPPEFLSTHPSDATRIHDIQTKYMPEAMKYYTKQ